MKQGVIEQDGYVTEASGRGIFKVEIPNGMVLTCTSSGKMRQNNIKIIPGDKVKIEMSPYDLSRGRISFRYKNEITEQ